jgi:hypothetical protein
MRSVCSECWNDRGMARSFGPRQTPMQSMDVDPFSYSVANWLRLQPAIHMLKTARYRHIDRQYRSQPPRVSVLSHSAASGSNLLISIAFEDADLIDWQSRLVRRYVPSAEYVVVDNSRSVKGAQAIRRICEKRGCSYLLTPENPWHGSASRSHGLALNWALENVVRSRRPKAFGFIDADVFPLEVTNPFEPLKQQDFFGVVRHSGERWYLWAGFCFFQFSLVERFPLNFSQAWFLGLDTGGANWNALYKHYRLSTLEQMETSFFPFKPGLDISEGPLQRCGPWIHEIGQMGRPDLVSEKREALRRLLEQYLD